ncbi:carboxylesterase family protein [Nocardia sp. CDC159]|uniref:Carboxylic ester hydrolase n=1 Tax=Nocardia pulmonis TaxID=2951408 RepID=A0A9X2EHY5_9NOCA|nr:MULTISPECIES: carboxylesterase family protein [Nocardia]MCM6778558.1 carboxylesterase family protein [Nocardia pulmonis]MCM6791447.1 carboxylesterase family protein [Nocardia sp. CDC159]
MSIESMRVTPLRRTTEGMIRGTVVDGVAVFRGIPYAQPPVGRWRFAAPQHPLPWTGVRPAVRFGPPSPQPTLPGSPPVPTEGLEDPDQWLTLNIWTPDPEAGGLPVMVWIHGGANQIGWSGLPLYDGSLLAGHGVVVVTVNYRLGFEGFARIADAIDNRGLLDQAAALAWIQRNIASFGGDPDNVTVFGQSSGGGSVLALMTMPAARGLFTRAIAQSPSAYPFGPELADAVCARIAETAGVEPTTNALARLTPRQLVEVTQVVQGAPPADWWGSARHFSWLLLFGPVVDGVVLPRAPRAALADGVGREIDLLIGHTRDEWRIFGALPTAPPVTPELTEQVLRDLWPGDPEQYRAAFPDADHRELHELVLGDRLFRMPTVHLAQAHSAAGGRTHLYELRYDRTPVGAAHSADLPLVFGSFAAAGSIHRDPPEAGAVALAADIRASWTAFARTGNPGWPVYREHDQQVRLYDNDGAHTGTYPETRSQSLWQRHALGAPLPLGENG